MKRCRSCGVEILDDTHVCPLCRQVLEEDGKPQESRYPDAIGVSQKLRFWENLLFLLSIVTASGLFGCRMAGLVDGATVLLTGLILIYINVLLRMSILGRSGYLFKAISGLLFSIIALEGVDILTGDQGWSLGMVWPLCVLALDLMILILMIVNRRNWQSYMMQQIFAIILSLVPLICLLLGKIHFPYLVWAAAAASALLFLSTLIMGDRRAREELRRRFHI